MQRYERTQHATWAWLVLLPVGLIVAAFFQSPNPETFWVMLTACALVILALAAFTRLTIRVDATAITWAFGWGWPASALRLADIERCEITRTNFLEGWGLHWTIWHGWLWNVAGFQAVEIFKRGGARVTLGTDDPQGLWEAIERFRKGGA